MRWVANFKHSTISPEIPHCHQSINPSSSPSYKLHSPHRHIGLITPSLDQGRREGDPKERKVEGSRLNYQEGGRKGQNVRFLTTPSIPVKASPAARMEDTLGMYIVYVNVYIFLGVVGMQWLMKERE